MTIPRSPLLTSSHMSRHISTIVVARRVTYALVLIGRATLLATIAMLLSCKELRAQQNTTTAITLGDAARIAAERSATTAAAHARSAQAQARVAQQRSSLLPSLSSTTQIGARTYNTATLGLDVPGPSGSPMFDASGEVMGPIHNTDFRTQ